MLLFASMAFAGWTAPKTGWMPVLPSTSYVLLATEVPDSWHAPTLAIERRPDKTKASFLGMSAIGRWEVAKLPKAQAAWKGKKVYVRNRAGAHCEATVGELSVIVRNSWMEGYEDYQCDVEGAACDASLLESLGRVPERLLVGKLSQDCAGEEGGWANTKDVPMVAGIDVPEGTQRANAVERFQALSNYAAINTAWTESGESGPWADPSVTRFVIGDRVYISVSASAGMCTNVDAKLWAVWEIVKGDGARTWKELTATGGVRDSFYAGMAADQDGDGVPELLREGGIAGVAGGKVVKELDLEWPWIGCAC